MPPKLGKIIGETLINLLNSIDPKKLEQARNGYEQLKLFSV